jgi:hypothetical protein
MIGNVAREKRTVRSRSLNSHLSGENEKDLINGNGRSSQISTSSNSYSDEDRYALYCNY